MKISIQWQDQFGHWKHYQMMHHFPGAYRTAKHRAKHTEKRHRLVNEDGTLLDLVETIDNKSNNEIHKNYRNVYSNENHWKYWKKLWVLLNLRVPHINIS